MEALHSSSPSNPTGTVNARENLRDLMAYCRKEGIAFISDELYHGLVYDEVAASAVEFGDEAIVINGFSKYFTMPGLRLGWMVLPEALVRPAEIIAQNLYISAPTLSQYAALEAFDYDYLLRVRETFRRRRDFLYEALGELFPIDARPDGAFYLWADVSAWSDDAVAFAEELLRECHVAITPGIDFGTNGTRHYLRFSYTREMAHMREGVERLRRYLRERKSQ
jgi:aspartate/methionine/tyrosine aminotransferase